MAQLDGNIFFQQKTPDVFGAVQEGVKMSDMLGEIKKKKALGEAYKVGGGDPKATMKALSSAGFGKESMELEEKSLAQETSKIKLQSEKINRHANYMGNALKTLGDSPSDNTYQSILSDAKQNGYDISTYPPNWGPEAEKKLRFDAGLAFTAQDRWNQQYKYDALENDKKKENKTFELKEREVRAAEMAAGLKAQRDAASGEYLPLDKKKIVENLSTKNASKLSIKNQLDAFVRGMDDLSADQKIVQGRQLLKTLNSPEGADAIGAEEAKRLGGLLEFKMFNFTQPGSFIGRDIDEFKTQVEGTSKSIGEGIRANKSEVDSLMGRQQGKQIVKTQTNKKTGEQRVVYSDGTFEIVKKVAGGK